MVLNPTEREKVMKRIKKEGKNHEQNSNPLKKI
jgi:hypothetical protein